MSKSIYERVYEHLPVPLQNAACTYYGFREKRSRLNEHFRPALESLRQTEFYDRAAIEAYQNEKVRELARHAYDSVPYYAEQWRSLGITPDDVRTVADLQKLPVLTKENVRAGGDRLLAQNARKQDLVQRHTSGTTGKSLHFYYSRRAVAMQWAVWWRHRGRFDFHPGDAHLNFTGKIVVPVRQTRPPFWRYNAALNQYITSMQQMLPGRVGDLAGLIERRKIDVLTGYPSVIHDFFLALAEAKIELNHRPRLIVTGAENVLEDQRRDITGAIPGVVFTDQYGFSEGCGNMSHCERLRYHEDFEFGVVELVDPVKRPDGRIAARIVCTGFACPEYPMIRYATGDTAILAESEITCECGRHSRIVPEIEGRIDDYVVTPEGHHVMRFDYIFKDTDAIREAQVVQRERGAIVIRVVRRAGYSPRDEEYVTREIHRWISPTLRVNFEHVDEIEREANGKFRAVLSQLQR